MSAMFASPPKSPPLPKLKPVQNTELTAQIAAQNRRMGAGGTVLSGTTSDTTGRVSGGSGANTLTGN